MLNLIISTPPLSLRDAQDLLLCMQPAEEMTLYLIEPGNAAAAHRALILGFKPGDENTIPEMTLGGVPLADIPNDAKLVKLIDLIAAGIDHQRPRPQLCFGID